MCKYTSKCKLCSLEIEIDIEQKNMNDAELIITSACPKISRIADHPFLLDAVYEMIVPIEKSRLHELLAHDNGMKGECSLYDSVREAVGSNLARYHEIA